MRGLSENERLDKFLDPAVKAMAKKVDQVVLRSLIATSRLKLFKFTIGPYQFLAKDGLGPFLYVFVVATSKAEAVRLKRAQDATCDPKVSIRARRHKWRISVYDLFQPVLA